MAELPGIEALRKRLLDTGTRNPLVHVNRQTKRANSLNIVRERSNDIYQLLRVKEKKMRFRARDREEEELESNGLHLELDREGDESGYRDNWLETELGPQALEKRLSKLYRDARSIEEERGANFLFLALGFLGWYEDEKSSVLREAPLVLLPVQLTRLKKGFSFTLSARPDDITSNLSLEQRLAGDFGIQLPTLDDNGDFTPEGYFRDVAKAIEHQERWRIDSNGMRLGFFSFAKALMYRDLLEENWPEGALAQSELIQGLLDTNKQINSLPPALDPEKRLDTLRDPEDLIHVVEADASQARVIEEVRAGRNLVIQGPPGTGKSQTITNIIAAAAHDGKTVLFMAEKMAALQVVYNRLIQVDLQDLCLELHARTANKKAFYAELQRTLDAGRGAQPMPADARALAKVRDQLNADDQILHEKLPEKDYTPFDVIAELCRFHGDKAPPPPKELPWNVLANLSNDQRDSLGRKIQQLARTLRNVGPVDKHPFFGARAIDLQPTDRARLEEELAKAIESVDHLLPVATTLARRLHLAIAPDLTAVKRLAEFVEVARKSPEGGLEMALLLVACDDFSRLMDGLERFRTWRDEKNRLEAEFVDAAWNAEVEKWRPSIAAGLDSVLARWFGKYRRVSKSFAVLLKRELPRSPSQRLSLLDALIAMQRKRADLTLEEEWFSATLGFCWQGECTDVDALVAAGRWVADLGDVLQLMEGSVNSETVKVACALATETQDGNDPLQKGHDKVLRLVQAVEKRLSFTSETALEGSESLAVLRERLALMHDQFSRYEEWTKLQQLRQELIKSGLDSFVQRMDDAGAQRDSDQAKQEFLYSVAEARWKHVRSSCSEIDRFARLDRHDRVTDFRRLDTDRLQEVGTLVRSRHLAQLPTGAVGEMAFLRGESGKKTRHQPVRKAFLSAPNMILRIKPVLLMSPISIAQFLPPGKIKFDLVLIDEASQVRPEDALGCMARARQIVVVGDDKQLPPTSFFARITGDLAEDEDEETDAPSPAAGAAEMESILTLATVRGLRQDMLEWHYRSRDPSLIKVSNHEFYDNRLLFPPSSLEKDDDFGMKLTRVPGVYHSKSKSRSQADGRPGTNRVEAEHIADALIQHAEDEDRREQSIGVVAFSKAQSDMITEVLEVRRRKNSTLDALLRSNKKENAFVKNIENVQGDERDAILISVGYGPHEPDGPLRSMRFGPINSEGGERRLNVLFTRARMRCQIFVSFDWRDIDLQRTPAEGPRVLRQFLKFAATGWLETMPEPTGGGYDSPLEEDVAGVIRQFGYPLDPQVGSRGFRIDLGVRHPKYTARYILAVECDGAAYHSALWARERDRLRQQVLENQGWRFHRIWSTDWFHRREHEIKRLHAALKQAREQAGEGGFRPPGANRVEGKTGKESSESESPEFRPSDAGSDAGQGHTGRTDDTYKSCLEVQYQNAFGAQVHAGRTGRDVARQSGLSRPSRAPAVPASARKAPPYQCANVRAPGFSDITQASDQEMVSLVRSIIVAEGPIHETLVARRVATALGQKRTGSRIRDATGKGLALAVALPGIMRSGAFYMTSAQYANTPVRDRSGQDSELLTADFLPPMEICRAAEWAERENGVLQGEEQIRAVARILGSRRAGKKLQERIARVLKGASKGHG